MSTPPSRLKLPAGFGDCLCSVVRSATAPGGCSSTPGPTRPIPPLGLASPNCPLGPNGKRHIDLFIVSHIDHEHVGGAPAAERSVAPVVLRGHLARTHLHARPRAASRRASPWRSYWGRHSGLCPGIWCSRASRYRRRVRGEHIELAGPGIPRVTVLRRRRSAWRTSMPSDKELERLRRKERDRADREPAPSRDGTPTLLDLESIASRDTPTDHAFLTVPALRSCGCRGGHRCCLRPMPSPTCSCRR